MLYTIERGSRVSVQGELVAVLDNGELVVRDGAKLYQGLPIGRPDPARRAAIARAAPAEV